MQEETFWEVMAALHDAGASEILVAPIEKLVMQALTSVSFAGMTLRLRRGSQRTLADEAMLTQAEYQYPR